MMNHILSVKFGTLAVELLIKNAAIIGGRSCLCGSLTDAAPFHFMRHEIKQNKSRVRRPTVSQIGNSAKRGLVPTEAGARFIRNFISF
jgi:hypothetical protein